jgi:hypothetical protein
MPGPNDLPPLASKDTPFVHMHDKLGHPILDIIPVDHALLIYERLHYNSQKDMVRWERVYKTSETDPTPITYQKRIIPGNGNETVATTVTVYPWERI